MLILCTAVSIGQYVLTTLQILRNVFRKQIQAVSEDRLKRLRYDREG